MLHSSFFNLSDSSTLRNQSNLLAASAGFDIHARWPHVLEGSLTVSHPAPLSLGHPCTRPQRNGSLPSVLARSGSGTGVALQQSGRPCNDTHRALVALLMGTAQQQYIQGATVLAKSSLRHAPGYFSARLLLLLNGSHYEEGVLQQARLAGWRLTWVEPITPVHADGTAELKAELARLYIWALEGYDQVVYMDLDTAFVAPLTAHIVPPAVYPTTCKLWAARDISNGTWLDAFNMGVLGIRPDQEEFQRLKDLVMHKKYPLEHALLEQGFLNKIYKSKNGQWCELDFEWNANLATYTQLPLLWMSAVPEVIHFTVNKPWECQPEYKAVCSLWDLELTSQAHPVTVVSAYFAGRNKHGAAKYATWAKSFVAHKMPLVFVTDNPAEVTGLLDRAANITKIIVMNQQSFFTSNKDFNWSKQLELDPEINIHSEHVFKVWLEKTNLVLTVIAQGPYRSEYYVWVDCGIFRSDDWGDRWGVHAERFPVDSRRMLMLNSPAPGTRKHIGGGVFGGSKVAWRLWSVAFYNTVQQQYRKGVFIGDDQIPMSMVAHDYPHLVCRVQPQSINGSDPWFFILWYLASSAPMQSCTAPPHR